MNTTLKTVVELKRERSALVEQRKSLADALRERDLNDDEQSQFDDMTAQIAALTKRIDALEKVENDENDPEEESPEVDVDPDQPGDRSSKRSRLEFPKISTSKTRGSMHGLFSVRRSLDLITRNKELDGYEREMSRDCELRGSGCQNGGNMMIPFDAKLPGNYRVRDLTTSSGAGAVGILVEPTFIELLRARMLCQKLGVTVEQNVKGKYAKPRQNAASQLTYIGEGSSATPTNPTFDQVNFTPRTASVQVNISRKSLFEMSIDAEAAVVNDILKVLAIGLDTAVFAGPGTGAGPTGIIYDSSASVGPIAAGATNGGHLLYSDLLVWEATLANSNADRGSINWVTTPGIRSYLKNQPKIVGSQTYPSFCWNDDNTVLGYPAHVTTEMPINLTTGTSSNCQSIIFGNFEDAVLALWGGTEVLVNPYVNATQGAVQYNLFQEMDTQRMHSNSFVYSTAVLAS